MVQGRVAMREGGRRHGRELRDRDRALTNSNTNKQMIIR